MKRKATQKQNESEDLLDIALGGASAVGGLSHIAGARVVIRGIADQIHVLTSVGNEALEGYIANGFAYALLQVDHDLETAMGWLRDKAKP